MERSSIHKAFHGDVIELIPSKYFYRIEFVPPPQRLHKMIAIKSEMDSPVQPAKKRSASPLCNDGDTPASAAPSKKIRSESKQFPCKANLWESIDDGKMLVYTTKDVCASQKV